MFAVHSSAEMSYICSDNEPLQGIIIAGDYDQCSSQLFPVDRLKIVKVHSMLMIKKLLMLPSYPLNNMDIKS